MTKLEKILRVRCPKCGESPMFNNNNPYKFKHLFDMKESCPSCGQAFELETGFYYGAMYVSYALSLMIFLPAFYLMHITFDLSLLISFLGMIFISLLSTPYLVRMARTLWLSFFIKRVG